MWKKCFKKTVNRLRLLQQVGKEYPEDKGHFVGSLGVLYWCHNTCYQTLLFWQGNLILNGQNNSEENLRGRHPFLGSHLVHSLKLPALLSKLSLVAMTVLYVSQHLDPSTCDSYCQPNRRCICETWSQNFDYFLIEIHLFLEHNFKRILENMNLIKIFNICIFGFFFPASLHTHNTFGLFSPLCIQEMCLNRLFKS